ncbi:MAG: tetraacyldisaccharide 4'-kinase [Bacteroidales bacterium]|nr:tetraacyldisaccharide 4'-kinase [Bacteroidales bacterium]
MTRFLQIFLYPFSICFGLLMQFRNLLFDFHIFKSASFSKPVISVGNLSYGGTGKTPHVEYLVRLLQPYGRLATLSRGYGRKSKGFVLGIPGSDVLQLGDEPVQYLNKFEQIVVAVDEKRKRGIQNLLQQFPDLTVILLDDAYQHRYVKPGISILLTDYHRLYPEDFVIPSGTLREFRSNASRADIIIVTKTPKIFSPITRRRILGELKLKSHQQLYFSYIRYLDPVPFIIPSQYDFPDKLTNILLFTGIANDYPLKEHLSRMCSEIITLKFSDHHPYSVKDIEEIVRIFNDLPTHKKVLVTTEKDAMRLKVVEPDTKLGKLPLFYVPMEVAFHGTDKELFDNQILKYATKDQRDR